MDTPYGLAALAAEFERVARAGSGTRNSTLNLATFKLAQHIAGGQLDEATVRSQMRIAAKVCGLDPHEVEATLASALRANVEARVPEPREYIEATRPGRVEPEPEVVREDFSKKILTTDQLAQIKPPTPLIAGFLYRNTLAWIAAAPGSYKTILSIHFAACVANGIPCMLPTGSVSVAQGDVLYISGEGASGLYARTAAWTAVYGGGQEPAIKWLPEAVQVSGSAWYDLCAYVGETKPALIILDTQSRMTVGLDENDAKSASMVVQQLDALRRASGACVLTNHHSSKSGMTMRGSSVIEGAADTVIALDRPDEEDQRVVVRCAKQKDAAPFRKFVMEPSSIAGSIVLKKAGSDVFDTKSKTYRSR